MTELVFRDNAYAKSCAATVTAADARGIRLDRTVFYAESGGQPGDIGVLDPASGAPIVIVDTEEGRRARRRAAYPGAKARPCPRRGTAVSSPRSTGTGGTG